MSVAASFNSIPNVIYEFGIFPFCEHETLIALSKTSRNLKGIVENCNKAWAQQFQYYFGGIPTTPSKKLFADYFNGEFLRGNLEISEELTQRISQGVIYDLDDTTQGPFDIDINPSSIEVTNIFTKKQEIYAHNLGEMVFHSSSYRTETFFAFIINRKTCLIFSRKNFQLINQFYYEYDRDLDSGVKILNDHLVAFTFFDGIKIQDFITGQIFYESAVRIGKNKIHVFDGKVNIQLSKKLIEIDIKTKEIKEKPFAGSIEYYFFKNKKIIYDYRSGKMRFLQNGDETERGGFDLNVRLNNRVHLISNLTFKGNMMYFIGVGYIERYLIAFNLKTKKCFLYKKLPPSVSHDISQMIISNKIILCASIRIPDNNFHFEKKLYTYDFKCDPSAVKISKLTAFKIKLQNMAKAISEFVSQIFKKIKELFIKLVNTIKNLKITILNKSGL